MRDGIIFRHREGKETDGDRRRQTETDGDRQRQTETDRDRRRNRGEERRQSYSSVNEEQRG